MRWMRPGSAALGGVLALALVTSSALADTGGGPIRYLVTPVGFTFTLFAPNFCADDVQVVVTASRDYEMDFPMRPDGTSMSIISGRFVVSMTNLTTGQVLNVGTPGPEQFTFYSDGSARLVGAGQFINLEYGIGVFLVRGTFNALTGQSTGTSTNLCLALGA